jgi:hypothetical protein
MRLLVNQAKRAIVATTFGLCAALCAITCAADVSAQESFRNGAKATEGGIGSAASLLLPAQASQDDMPQDKEVIAFIKNSKRVDFRKMFPSDWEAICFSGEYQHPVRDIKYELGKDFPACSGTYSNTRWDRLSAITIVWPQRCRVIEVNTSDFFIESQNGTSCYKRETINEFSLQKSPVGVILEQKKHSQLSPSVREGVMNEREEYTFIEMNCPYLVEFQRELRAEFIKSPQLGKFSEEFNNRLAMYEVEDIKKFLHCFDSIEEGKEDISKTGKDIYYINAAVPFLYASDKQNSQLRIKVFLQIYISFYDDKLNTINIMTNF